MYSCKPGAVVDAAIQNSIFDYGDLFEIWDLTEKFNIQTNSNVVAGFIPISAKVFFAQKYCQHRTLNIERPTSNKELCHFKKRLEKPSSPNWLCRPRAQLSFEIYPPLVDSLARLI